MVLAFLAAVLCNLAVTGLPAGVTLVPETAEALRLPAFFENLSHAEAKDGVKDQVGQNQGPSQGRGSGPSQDEVKGAVKSEVKDESKVVQAVEHGEEAGVQRRGEYLIKSDVDGDTIEEDEEAAEAALRKGFEGHDRDGNGLISLAELQRVYLAEQANHMIWEADVDGDGQINYEEYAEAPMTETDTLEDWAASPVREAADRGVAAENGERGDYCDCNNPGRGKPLS